jgi:hypothetical protein
MLAYVVGKICAVDGWISIHCTYFAYSIRQHISSLRETQELPEDGNKLLKHVGAKG